MAYLTACKYNQIEISLMLWRTWEKRQVIEGQKLEILVRNENEWLACKGCDSSLPYDYWICLIINKSWKFSTLKYKFATLEIYMDIKYKRR